MADEKGNYAIHAAPTTIYLLMVLSVYCFLLYKESFLRQIQTPMFTFSPTIISENGVTYDKSSAETNIMLSTVNRQVTMVAAHHAMMTTMLYSLSPALHLTPPLFHSFLFPFLQPP